MDSKAKVSIKCVLLGNADVGKSCLVERFLRHQWKNDTAPTIGTAFGVKTLTVSVYGQSYTHTMGVWDTAGSERYYSMTQHYFNGTHAAIVCFDLTDLASWEKVTFWVKELRKVEEEAVITLVGTKLDLLTDGKQKRCVSKEVVAAYAKTIGASVYDSSALIGQNVEQAFVSTVRTYVKKYPLRPGTAAPLTGGVKLTSKKPETAAVSGCACMQN